MIAKRRHLDDSRRKDDFREGERGGNERERDDNNHTTNSSRRRVPVSSPLPPLPLSDSSPFPSGAPTVQVTESWGLDEDFDSRPRVGSDVSINQRQNEKRRKIKRRSAIFVSVEESDAPEFHALRHLALSQDPLSPAEKEERLDRWLHNNPLFSSLPADLRHDVYHEMVLGFYPANTVVFRQGEWNDTFYVIDDGHCMLTAVNTPPPAAPTSSPAPPPGTIASLSVPRSSGSSTGSSPSRNSGSSSAASVSSSGSSASHPFFFAAPAFVFHTLEGSSSSSNNQPNLHLSVSSSTLSQSSTSSSFSARSKVMRSSFSSDSSISSCTSVLPQFPSPQSSPCPSPIPENGPSLSSYFSSPFVPSAPPAPVPMVSTHPRVSFAPNVTGGTGIGTSGNMSVTLGGFNGLNQQIQFKTAGQMLGALSLIQPSAMEYTAVTQRDCQIWSLDGGLFRYMVTNRAKTKYEHLRAFLEVFFAQNRKKFSSHPALRAPSPFAYSLTVPGSGCPSFARTPSGLLSSPSAYSNLSHNRTLSNSSATSTISSMSALGSPTLTFTSSHPHFPQLPSIPSRGPSPLPNSPVSPLPLSPLPVLSTTSAMTSCSVSLTASPASSILFNNQYIDTVLDASVVLRIPVPNSTITPENYYQFYKAHKDQSMSSAAAGGLMNLVEGGHNGDTVTIGRGRSVSNFSTTSSFLNTQSSTRLFIVQEGQVEVMVRGTGEDEDDSSHGSPTAIGQPFFNVSPQHNANTNSWIAGPHDAFLMPVLWPTKRDRTKAGTAFNQFEQTAEGGEHCKAMDSDGLSSDDENDSHSLCDDDEKDDLHHDTHNDSTETTTDDNDTVNDNDDNDTVGTIETEIEVDAEQERRERELESQNSTDGNISSAGGVARVLLPPFSPTVLTSSTVSPAAPVSPLPPLPSSVPTLVLPASPSSSVAVSSSAAHSFSSPSSTGSSFSSSTPSSTSSLSFRRTLNSLSSSNFSSSSVCSDITASSCRSSKSCASATTVPLCGPARTTGSAPVSITMPPSDFVSIRCVSENAVLLVIDPARVQLNADAMQIMLSYFRNQHPAFSTQ